MDAVPRSDPDRPVEAAAGIRLSPFCVRLRSKKSYFLRGPPMEEEDLLDGSGHCWCLHTMNSRGPDGGSVSPAECRTGRACFESIL